MIHHILTASRVMISPFMMWFLYQKCIKISIFLSIFAIFSDVFDGFFARFLNKQSNFGAKFDVFADKFFLYMSIFGSILSKKNRYIFSILTLWIVRDFILFIAYLYKNKPFKSLKIGKLYTGIQFLFILYLSFFTFNICVYKVYFILFFSMGIGSIIGYLKLFYDK